MKNNFEIRGEVTAIFINSPRHGYLETLISTKHLERVQEFPNTWCVSWCKDTESFYCIGSLPRNKAKRKHVYLHRWITTCPPHMQVDHINHNTLENTADNLRIVTGSENHQNRRGPQRNSKSGIRGVRWHKGNQRWRAEITIKRKLILIGEYDTAYEAEAAVKLARATRMPFNGGDGE